MNGEIDKIEAWDAPCPLVGELIGKSEELHKEVQPPHSSSNNGKVDTLLIRPVC